MPFVGLHLESDRRVNILDIENPKVQFKPNAFVCPYCNQPMTIRRAHRRSEHYVHAHFVHLGECAYEYHLPESIEHLTAKMYLSRRLSRVYGEDADVSIEYPIEMSWRDKGRIADVAVIYPTGYTEAHEIQLSPIKVAEFGERVNDYDKAGIQSFWYFGDANFRDRNLLDYALHQCGGYGKISFTYKGVNL